jgi:hypothetical protein
MNVNLERLQAFQANTFRLLPHLRLDLREKAVAYVNERGFIFFWPIKEVQYPSLWGAVAGDRPVADEHDDPGHITWGWKDALLGKRQWYYARILRKRNTILSLEAAPYFYALSNNFGAPEEDYQVLYQQGKLTQEARLVYEALLDKGPLDTIALRKAAHLSSRESDSRFNKALNDLQEDFKVIPVGIAEAGAWNYAFVYDLVHRHFPDLPEQAHAISEAEAYRKLAELYWKSVGAARENDLVKLFRWPHSIAERTLQKLVEYGILQGGYQVPGKTGEWFVLNGL